MGKSCRGGNGALMFPQPRQILCVATFPRIADNHQASSWPTWGHWQVRSVGACSGRRPASDDKDVWRASPGSGVRSLTAAAIPLPPRGDEQRTDQRPNDAAGSELEPVS